jgi:hypothetical protein
MNERTIVTLELKKERKPKTRQRNPRYDSSVHHRAKRSYKERRVLAKSAQRILDTIKLSALEAELDAQCKQFYSVFLLGNFFCCIFVKKVKLFPASLKLHFKRQIN